MQAGVPIISLTEVSVRKMGTPVLEGIDWDIHHSENWAIIGPNGSGKSVLLETLAGKLIPSAGSLVRKGSLEFVASDYKFNRIIHSAAQYYQQRFQADDAALAPTLYEVLTHQLKPVGTINAASVTLEKPEIPKEKLDEIVALLGLAPLLHHPFVTLSNGETRRMLLALSLMKKPQLLLMDSPFTGLDVTARENLSETLRKLSDQGVGSVMITTENEIPAHITNVLELENGRVKKKELRASWVPSPKNARKLDLKKFLAENKFGQNSDFEFAFKLTNIRVVYSGEAVLDKVNWNVRRGERWSLSGHNGSGKSTLLSIINADHPQRFANQFEIFDRPNKPRGLSMWEIKQHIGYVSPELHLYFPPEILVRKAIASGFFDATGVYFKKIDAAQEHRISEVAKALGIEELLENTFSGLSKGQQRVVLLARALVKLPPLLILDEPCQGLDSEMTERFNSIIDQLCQQSDLTVIYVTHYASETPKCVSKFIQLKSGRVIS